MTLEGGKLVQKQTCEGRETTIEREIVDGKLIMVRVFAQRFAFKFRFFFYFCLSNELHVTEITHELFMERCAGSV